MNNHGKPTITENIGKNMNLVINPCIIFRVANLLYLCRTLSSMNLFCCDFSNDYM